MQAADHRLGDDAADVLDRPAARCIFAHWQMCTGSSGTSGPGDCGSQPCTRPSNLAHHATTVEGDDTMARRAKIKKAARAKGKTKAKVRRAKSAAKRRSKKTVVRAKKRTVPGKQVRTN